MSEELEKLPLREKKYATLKLKILDAFIEKSKDTNVENISVKEIAKELQISEMTFYNYFKNKKELFIYFIELWNIEMNLNLQEAKHSTSIDSIYLIYKLSAKYINVNYQFMMELIAFLAINGIPKKDIEITKAETLIRFGSSSITKEGGFKELMMPLLQDAIDKQEIQENNIEILFTGLYNTFFATPMMLNYDDVDKLDKIYTEQINNVLGIK